MSELPAGWRLASLSDTVELQRGFDLPAHARRPGPFPVLTSGEGGGFHDEGPIPGPGFVVGRATNLGRPKWSSGDFWPHNTTMFAKDFKGNNPRWLFHLFEATDLSGFDSGSVQPMLNRNYIAQVRVAVPPLPEQQAIAEVLGALDDKIVANTALAERAESLAIVEVSTIAEVVPLGELVALQKKQVNPEHLGGELVDHFSLPAFDSERLPSVEMANTIKSNKFEIVDDVVLLSKLNPRFPRVWRAAPSERRALASTEFLVLAPIDMSTQLLWAALSQSAFSTALEARVAGTSGSHQRVKPADALTVEVPDVRTLPVSMRSAIEAMLSVASVSRIENRTLAETRDALLPQLMSGKLRVRDAERIAAEAGA